MTDDAATKTPQDPEDSDPSFPSLKRPSATDPVDPSPDKTPKPGSALAAAVAALEDGGIGYTLNPSMETSIRFVGPLGVAALAGEPPVAPPVAPDEEPPQPDAAA